MLLHADLDTYGCLALLKLFPLNRFLALQTDGKCPGRRKETKTDEIQPFSLLLPFSSSEKCKKKVLCLESSQSVPQNNCRVLPLMTLCFNACRQATQHQCGMTMSYEAAVSQHKHDNLIASLCDYLLAFSDSTHKQNGFLALTGRVSPLLIANIQEPMIEKHIQIYQFDSFVTCDQCHIKSR